MQYDFDEPIDRTGTCSVKFDVGRAQNPNLPADYIPLWIADMDFACAEPILDAMRKRLDRRILGYSTTDHDEYRETVVRWMKRRYDFSVDPASIAFSSGVVMALFAAVELYTKPDDAVLVMTPAYHPFDAAIKHYARTPLYSRLIGTDGYYTMDWDDFEQKAARKDCSLLFLCSPQNPTGRVWTEDELRRIGEICFANHVFVVSDEIHADLIRVGQTHIPFAKLFPNESRLITCTSPSKTFNIAGNRHANILIPDADVRRVWNERANCGHPGALSIDAAMAAYTSCDSWLDALRVYLDESFARLNTMLKERLPKAVFRIPEGTYLAWINFEKLGLSDEKLNELVSKAGVFAEFAGDFVDNANGCMRVNMASPHAVLDEGFTRICGALERF